MRSRAKRNLVVAGYAVLSAMGRLDAAWIGVAANVYDPQVHYHEVRRKWFGLSITHGDGHHHSHAPEVSPDNERQIFLAMLLTGGFMVVEVVGGVLSGSLALIADAGHMATDAAALLLAWLAFRLSRRPADDHRSYGYYRGEVLAAFVNGVAMLALVVWIFYEALHRLFEPTPVLGWSPARVPSP